MKVDNSIRLLFGVCFGGVAGILFMFFAGALAENPPHIIIPVAFLVVWPVVGSFAFVNAQRISDWMDRE